MSLLEISLFSAACVNIFIGFYAVYARPRRITSYALFLFAVGLGIWVGSFFFLLVTHDFWFDKINHYAGLLFIGGLFLLALTFPDKKFRAPYLLAYVPFVFGILFVARGGVVLTNTFGPGDSITPIQGPFFPYYAAGLITYVLVSLILFAITYRNLRGIERLRMKYLFLGILMFVLPVCICDIALPAIGFYYLNLIGPLASVGFVAATSYAVLRHQLMDIRVAIQRGTIYSLLTSLIIVTYTGLLLFINDLFDASMRIAAPLSAGIVIIISIITIPRIERYFRKVTDKVFFKDHYDYGIALERLSEILNANIHLAHLAPPLVITLHAIFKPQSLEFKHEASGLVFGYAQQPTVQEFSQPIPLHGIRVPVVARDRTIGVYTFGPKRSGDSYTTEDQQLLRTFSIQAAVAFEKAELYEQLEAHSRSLEDIVAERTKDVVELQLRQKELFDDISHALQTPLTILKSALELVKNIWQPQERKTLESMERSVNDLSGLIRDLLQLARIDAVLKDIFSRAVNLSALINDVIEYVEVICEQNEIKIKKDIEPNILIYGDEKQLSEVITNLLSNAVRYTAESPRKEISVRAYVSKNYLEVSISDTGIGIPEDKVAHIFDRFYRAQESSTSMNGYGLGLAIVKRIMDRHGGSIHAESTVGVGTTFTLRLLKESAAIVEAAEPEPAILP